MPSPNAGSPGDHRSEPAHPSAGRREAYYRELTAGYDEKIRQLVPGYEELMERLTELVLLSAPGSLLDVGCGPGALTERLARAIDGVRVVALEPSLDMAAAARSRLRPLADRVRVLERDVAGVEPGDAALLEASFDVVHSNLVLHNLPGPGKRRALEVAHRLLSPGGALVWGDLVRFGDHRLQRAMVERRIRHAREAGCPEPLIEWNFRKEAEDDFPLTAQEAVEMCRSAGFPTPDVAWARDTFLVLRAVKAGGSPIRPARP